MKQQKIGANMKVLAAVIATLVVIVSFQNCSQQKLAASSKSSNGNENTGGTPGGGTPPPLNLGPNDDEAPGVITQTGGPNCRNVLHNLTTPIKPVFIVDTSGSNKLNNYGQPGSDPNRVVRGDSIERFYNTYKLKSNFGWSFSTFAGSSANVLLTMGNATQMSNAIASFRAMFDSGETPYVAALNAAKANIQSDTGRAPSTKYLVVFLSDGLPNPVVADSTLTAKVNEITAILPGAISFNTIYYGAVDAAASNRLKSMAQTGGGNFLDTNANPTGQDFLITDFVVVPGVNCN
jgi:hypothetical protein